MISISRLLCDTRGPGDSLRYGQSLASLAPVVVWNCTSRCNLRCIHCYASAGTQRQGAEMDTKQATAFMMDLAGSAVPVVLFSGGEPLLRPDLFDVANVAVERGLRVALSSNGTIITDDIAKRLKATGFAEVGVSLDGTQKVHDRFRGTPGAYQSALDGIRCCVGHGLRVSLRFTMTRSNYREIPAMFRLAESEGIQRLCFYHLVYSGRGSLLAHEDLDHAQTRSVVDTICELTQDLYRRGMQKEVLTVANHADGVYLYLKLRNTWPQRARTAYELLTRNGGNSSGIRIGAVDPGGDVHPDQFWRSYSPGNVLERSFGEIWADTSDRLMNCLKDRKHLLKGRCSACAYVGLCNGNLRERAEAMYGDVWAEDPACYLTDEEIGAL